MNSMLRLRGQIMPALLPARARFISWRAGTIDARGIQKVPCDAEGREVDANDPQYWVDFETAMRRPWGIGLVLGDGIVAVDLDACYENGALKAIAADAWQALGVLGAYCERSISGQGLHLIFEAVLPAGHAVKRKTAPGLEVYSSRRFLALGDYLGGDARRDLTGPLMALMERHGLPLTPPARADVEEGRDPAWSGPEDDAELIGLMLAQGRRGGRMFAADAVTVAELWNCDVTAMARRWPAAGRPDKCPYDRSMADAAIMAELSYFTGRDQPRMVRLFERWPGYRPEHYEGKGGYRLARVLGLGVQNARVYQARSQVQAVQVAQAGPEAAAQPLGDYIAHLPSRTFYHRPTGAFWPVGTIDDLLPPVAWGMDSGGMPKTMKASKWLARNTGVHQRTWWPGMPEIIADYVIRDGEMIEVAGQRVLNTYRAPTPPMGNPADVSPWLDHAAMLYPDHWVTLIRWMAFVAQNPTRKVNWAMVLGGGSRIGKDTILAPLERAVGRWNRSSESPETILTSQFNEYLQCRYLIINEMKDTGQGSAFQLYNRLKTIIAAPPATHKINPKGLPPYIIPNLNATVMTTNYQVGGMYLPADDGRHLVLWSTVTRAKIDDSHFDRLWGWLNNGGMENCAAYLMALDVSDFNPSTPPEKTMAFWDMVESGQSSETSDLSDIIAKVSGDTFTIEQLAGVALMEFNHGGMADWLKNNANGTKIKRALADLGCVKYPNPSDTQRGRWYVNGRYVTLYHKPG